jgi:hypothetical protein
MMIRTRLKANWLIKKNKLKKAFGKKVSLNEAVKMKRTIDEIGKLKMNEKKRTFFLKELTKLKSTHPDALIEDEEMRQRRGN